MLGNANQLIITALIGLDAIDRGIITKAPENFPASWNPINCSTSARRSRVLILDMCLVRAADALDTYSHLVNRKPFLFKSADMKSELDGAGRSVIKKFNVFEKHIPIGDQVLSALIATMISWRNKAVHSEDRSGLNNIYRVVLENNAEDILKRFSGLNSSILIEGYSKNRTPHHKEVASFIKATHQYVQAVDANLLKTLDQERYLKELIWTGVCEIDSKNRFDDSKRKRQIHNKWGKSLCRKKNAVLGFLQRKGLSSKVPETKEPYVVFKDRIIKDVILMSPEQVYQWAKPTALGINQKNA